MRTPRQLRRRPSDEAVAAAMPKILAAAAGATSMTVAQIIACPRLGRRGSRQERSVALAVRVAVAAALVSRGVRVKEAIRHAEVGTTVYSRGVPPEHRAVLAAATKAAELALPSDRSRADRLRLANEVVADVARARGMSTDTLLERHTVAAREARAEVVRRLRQSMTNAEAAAALGLSRLTCYRLAKGGYHSTDDRRRPASRATMTTRSDHVASPA